MKKLSSTMKRALEKLTSGWETHWCIGEGLTTLNALVSRGLAETRVVAGANVWSFVTHYRLARKLKEDDSGHLVCATCGELAEHMDFVVETNCRLTWVDGDEKVEVLGCDTLLSYTNARMVCPCGVVIEEGTEFAVDDTRDDCWELKLKKGVYKDDTTQG